MGNIASHNGYYHQLSSAPGTRHQGVYVCVRVCVHTSKHSTLYACAGLRLLF